MRYVKLELMFGGQSQGSYIGTLEDIVGELEVARDNPGELEESWRVTFIDMPEDVFNELPEFPGW